MEGGRDRTATMIRLAVIGNPVAHSRSPEIHEMFAQQAGLDIQYERILAALDAFPESVQAFVDEGGTGFNVTLPFKHEAFRLADETSRAAKASETVNTMTALAAARLKGDNTDGIGLLRDIEVNLGWPIRGARILVLGAGGAVSGVLPAILEAGCRQLDIYNRTHARAQELETRFQGPVRAVDADALEGPYELVISGTSAGLSGTSIELPPGIVGGSSRCYDMIYAAETTAFNAWAIANGCRQCRDGLGMLVEQAAAAFDIWFGFKPETGPVINQLRERL